MTYILVQAPAQAPSREAGTLAASNLLGVFRNDGVLPFWNLPVHETVAAQDGLNGDGVPLMYRKDLVSSAAVWQLAACLGSNTAKAMAPPRAW